MAMAVWAAPSEAERIYKDAKNNQATKNYSSRSVFTVGKSKVTDSSFQQVSPEGIVRTRREVMMEPTSVGNPFNPWLVITNEDGRFQISKEQVMKLNYQFGRNSFDEKGLSIAYTLSDQDFEGIPCYKITRKIVFNQAARRAYIESLPSELQRDTDVNEQFPVLEVMLVGKRDLFPRQIEFYNQSGKLTEKNQFSNVMLNPVMPADLFEVPSLKIKVISSVDEYANFTSAKIEENVLKNTEQVKSMPWWDRFKSASGSWMDHNFSTIVCVGVWTGIVISIFSILAAIVLKIKQYRRPR